MKKILGIMVLGLLWCNSSNAGTLEEDWARDVVISQEGRMKCADYAHQSGSFIGEDFTICMTQFREMDNARIERREATRNQKCKAARKKNSSTSGSAALSNVENFLLGAMGQLSEDIACGY
tara:strand:+ start:51 stop:413 length:363 start_codon:yes stop_codon:yes gene_type:complete